MLNAYPGALRHDFAAPRYAAKLRFLEQSLGQDVGDVLATHPMYLTYRLDRIAVRAAYLTVSSAGRSEEPATGVCAVVQCGGGCSFGHAVCTLTR
jgi:hypothetical protein